MAFLLCVVPWIIGFMFGVVWVLDFFFLMISICTDLLCFGRGFLIMCSLLIVFWNIWVALKWADGRSKSHPDWIATEEAAAVEAVLWW